jgi:SAM-dependent methyltransferase
MNNIVLARVEAMSVAVTNQFAERRFWEDKPVPKDMRDVERFVEALPGKKILDLGCGYGMYAPDFMEAGLDYLGIDNSPKMICEARKDNPTARFQIMSLNRLMFPEESFDGIWACCSITTTPKSLIKGSLERMRQLLTPRGVMLVVVPNCYGFTFDGEHEQDEGPMWHAIYSAEELRELFRSCGFQVTGFWEDYDNNAMSLLARK